MTTIYAAVIEWPEDLSDTEPALILARTDAERDAEIRTEIRSMSEYLTDPEWRDAIAGAEDAVWGDWLDLLEETEYGRPFVSLYTREIPA